MKRNFIFTGIGIGSRLLSNLIVFVVLARYWGPTEFGRFSFLFSLSALIGIIVEYGLQTYLMRELDSTNDIKSKTVLSEALYLKLLLAPLYITVSFLVVCLTSNFDDLQLFLPIALSTILSSFAEFFVAALRAYGRYDKELHVVLLGNLAQFALAIAAVTLFGTAIAVAWAMVAGRGAYLLKAFVAIPAAIKPDRPPTGSLDVARRQISRTTAYAADGFLTTAWTQLDLVLVNYLYGANLTGLYSAGQRIVQGVSALAPVIGNVMLPRLARLARTADPNLNRTALKVLAMMSLLGTVFAAPIIAFPDSLSNFLYGEKFRDLPAVLPLLGVLLVARFCAGGTGLVVTALGLQKSRAKTQLVGLSAFLFSVAILQLLDLDITFFIGCLTSSTLLIGVLYGIKWCRFTSTS